MLHEATRRIKAPPAAAIVLWELSAIRLFDATTIWIALQVTDVMNMGREVLRSSVIDW